MGAGAGADVVGAGAGAGAGRLGLVLGRGFGGCAGEGTAKWMTFLVSRLAFEHLGRARVERTETALQ